MLSAFSFTSPARPLSQRLLLAVFISTQWWAPNSRGAQDNRVAPQVQKSDPVVIQEGDEEWETLVDTISSGQTAAPKARGEQTVTSALQDEGKPNLTKNAEQAKAFYIKHPGHRKVAEAKKIEANMRLHANYAADPSHTKGRDPIVSQFINDSSLPESQRAQVAGLRGFYEMTAKNLQGTALWAELEKMARQLIKDFPNQPQGYESLFTVAASVDEKKGTQLAAELITLSSPPALKQRAQMLLKRNGLIGKSAFDVLSLAEDSSVKSDPMSDKPTVIYGWALWNADSIALGQMLGSRSPGRFNLIGINLDSDSAAAARAAVEYKLPGILKYDAGGAQGALAQNLGIDELPTVFITDSRGIVRDVRGYENLDQKLTKLGL